MMKPLVGGQHCPLTDGTVHCPKEYSDHLSIHVNIIKYNCEYNVTVVRVSKVKIRTPAFELINISQYLPY